MLEIRYVTEQGQRLFPITHRQAVVGLSTNTLVLSEAVDVDVDINVDGEPITINPLVQKALDNVNIHLTNIDNGIVQINNTLKIKADSDSNGVAYTAHKLKTARNIALAGAVTGSVNFDGSTNVSITTNVSHTHSYAGSSSVGGVANSALKLNSARNIALSGVVNGSANFDGTGNINISTSFGNSANYLPLTGGTISGGLTVNGNMRTESRYYQNGTVGCIVAAQGGGPSGTMIWAW